MSWAALAAFLTVAAVALGSFATAIIWLAREILAHLRATPPPHEHAERIAARNGRPHASHVDIYPAKPPAE